MSTQWHELKTHPEYFQLVKQGLKNWELRKNDRNFQIGDWLTLREYDPETSTYTGNVIENLTVVFVLRDFVGLEPGYVILSLENVTS